MPFRGTKHRIAARGAINANKSRKPIAGMREPSDHLLRTFAAVPIESRVLDVGCWIGARTEALVQLGFDVFASDASPENVDDVRARIAVHVGEEEAHRRVSRAGVEALGYPDEFFDWVVAYGSLARLESREALLDGLSELRRVLRSGGWLYVAVPAVPEPDEPIPARGYAGDSGMKPTFSARTLDALMKDANFAVAQQPAVESANGHRILQAIYRRVQEGTPA